MQFLHSNECSAWCVERGAEMGRSELLPDPALGHRASIVFAADQSVGLEPLVASTCLSVIDDWDELLVWITEWGVWPSSENWPAFYALRGDAGEIASISYKPGHLLAPRERAEAERLLKIVLANGWGGYILPSLRDQLPLRIECSHDGWVELRTAKAARFELG